MSKKRMLLPCVCSERFRLPGDDMYYNSPTIHSSIDCKHWYIECSCTECSRSYKGDCSSINKAIDAWNDMQIKLWQHRRVYFPGKSSAIYVYRIEDEAEYSQDVIELPTICSANMDESWLGMTLAQLQSAYSEEELSDKIVCEFLATDYVYESNVVKFAKVSALTFNKIDNIHILYSGGTLDG